ASSRGPMARRRTVANSVVRADNTQAQTRIRADRVRPPASPTPAAPGRGAGSKMTGVPKLQLVQDPAADALLDDNPFALVVGMLLDQQVPMETAFAGPKKIADRMGGFDAGEIAEYDPDKFAALCSEKPAIHRFPGSMAKRIQALAQIIVDRYDGDAVGLWKSGDPDGKELLRRLKGLPGFGQQKAQIFLALLGKQYGVTPAGW